MPHKPTRRAALAVSIASVNDKTMLAWIANSAPRGYKATFFAVMTSFTNLALSLSQLGTKYLNQWFVVTREVHDPVSGVTLATANYAELGKLLIASNMLTLLIPMLAILLVQKLRHPIKAPTL